MKARQASAFLLLTTLTLAWLLTAAAPPQNLGPQAFAKSQPTASTTILSHRVLDVAAQSQPALSCAPAELRMVSLPDEADVGANFSPFLEGLVPQQSKTGPTPPPKVIARDARKPTDRAQDVLSQVTLAVPAYFWRHGCGPTAVGMVIGYYDTIGYDDLIPGSALLQTDEVNQAIASGGGSGEPYPPGAEHHYEDYARPEDSPPNLLPDDYITSGRTPHADDSLADYMHTSKSTRGNYYGWTWSVDIGRAFVDYVNKRNPAYRPNYLPFFSALGTMTWDVLISEIDAGRPMVFLVDSDEDGQTDHFVTVIGYRTNPSRQYGCWDTWSTTKVRWENFAPMAPGVPWGIWGGWAFRLTAPTPTPTATRTPTLASTPTPTSTPTGEPTFVVSLNYRGYLPLVLK